MELSLEHYLQHDDGPTRERVNAVTKEQLKVDVIKQVHKPNGEPSVSTKLTIQRKPTA